MDIHPFPSVATPAVVQEILKTEHFDIDRGASRVPAIVYPNERGMHGLHDLVTAWEKTQPAPYRRKGTYLAANVQSLIEWMERHTDEAAPVFGAGIEKPQDWKQPKLALIGIGNYSSAADPAWHDFRVRYDFPVSEQWAVWSKQHEQKMDQLDFAEFIENRIYDLSSPKRDEKLPESVTQFLENAEGAKAATPSQVYELSRGLKLTANSKLESKIDLGSGETTLKYTEEHNGAGGRPIKVPDLFYIRIPVFFGLEPTLVGARLRYRAHGGAVSWSFSLFAPDMIVAEQFNHACERLKNANRTVYLGTPDAP